MNEETKALTTVNIDLSYYLEADKFAHVQRLAAMFAQAKMIPRHYQGSPADCVIAINRAISMKIDISQFMEKTYSVGNKIGLESQLCVALANRAGVFKDVIQYKFTGKGDALTCTAYAVTAATGITCEASCSVQDAKDMGWWTRNGSPWPKQTNQMLRYRSATRLIKTYCPEVLMGLDSVEELRDYEATKPPGKNITAEVERSDLPKPDIEKPDIEKPDIEPSKEKPNPEEKPELHPDVLELKELYENPVHAADFAKLDRQEIEYAIRHNQAKSAAKLIEEAKIGG